MCLFLPKKHSIGLELNSSSCAHINIDRLEASLGSKKDLTWIKFERKSERQYVPKVTPTALARVGAVAERDMVLIYCWPVRFLEFACAMSSSRSRQRSKIQIFLDPPMVSHFRFRSNFCLLRRKFAEDLEDD